MPFLFVSPDDTIIDTLYEVEAQINTHLLRLYCMGDTIIYRTVSAVSVFRPACTVLNWYFGTKQYSYIQS